MLSTVNGHKLVPCSTRPRWVVILSPTRKVFNILCVCIEVIAVYDLCSHGCHPCIHQRSYFAGIKGDRDPSLSERSSSVHVSMPCMGSVTSVPHATCASEEAVHWHWMPGCCPRGNRRLPQAVMCDAQAAKSSHESYYFMVPSHTKYLLSLDLTVRFPFRYNKNDSKTHSISR